MSDRGRRTPNEDPGRRRRDAGPERGARGGEGFSRARDREQGEREYGDWVIHGAPHGNGLGDDEILRTDPRPDGGKEEARPGADPPPVEEAAPPPLGRRLHKGEAVPPGWLPSKATFTLEELFACAMTALAAFVIIGGAIAFAAGLLPIPEGVAQDPVPAALAGGASVGFYVLLKRRSKRLASRKHLRGEK